MLTNLFAFIAPTPPYIDASILSNVASLVNRCQKITIYKFTDLTKITENLSQSADFTKKLPQNTLQQFVYLH